MVSKKFARIRMILKASRRMKSIRDYNRKRDKKEVERYEISIRN